MSTSGGHDSIVDDFVDYTIASTKKTTTQNPPSYTNTTHYMGSDFDSGSGIGGDIED